MNATNRHSAHCSANTTIHHSESIAFTFNTRNASFFDFCIAHNADECKRHARFCQYKRGRFKYGFREKIFPHQMGDWVPCEEVILFLGRLCVANCAAEPMHSRIQHGKLNEKQPSYWRALTMHNRLWRRTRIFRSVEAVKIMLVYSFSAS